VLGYMTTYASATLGMPERLALGARTDHVRGHANEGSVEP
jgi:hypothetical protein